MRETAMMKIGVVCGEEKFIVQAKMLADDLNLPLISDDQEKYDYLMQFTKNGLQLKQNL